MYFIISCKGHDAPVDTPPLMLAKEGASRTNHSQFMPYKSSDSRIYNEVYENLTTVMGEVFEWIEQMVCIIIVKEHDD